MKKRISMIDTLRCFAIAAVLIQHSATANLEFAGSTRARAASLVFGLSRWNILLFIAISGFLFLDREIDFVTMWKKYIFRILIVFVAWSGLYTIYNLVININECPPTALIKNLIGDFFLGGTTRMWYLVMLVALYAFFPMFSRWNRSADEAEKRYALVLTGVLALLLPSLRLIDQFETVFGLDVDRMQGVYSSGYVFYSLLGYMLIKHVVNDDLKKGMELVVLYAGIVSVLAFGLLLAFTPIETDISMMLYLPIVAMIVLIAKKLDKLIYFHRIGRAFQSISECSFGIYLCHTAIEYVLRHLGIDNVFFRLPSLLGIGVYFIALFAMSWGVTSLLRKTKIGRAVT